jgi:hypothetical protein
MQVILIFYVNERKNLPESVYNKSNGMLSNTILSNTIPNNQQLANIKQTNRYLLTMFWKKKYGGL